MTDLRKTFIYKVMDNLNLEAVAPNDREFIFPRLDENKKEIQYFSAQGPDGQLIQSDNQKLLNEKIQQLENDYFVGLADKITDTKTGKLAGEYQNLTSQEYLDRLIPNLTRAAEEGFDQRYWYENSYNTINALVRGEEEYAEKFSQLIALYSPARTVQVNTSLAIKSWNKWASGADLWKGRVIDRITLPVNVPKLTESGKPTGKFTKWKKETAAQHGEDARLVDLDDGTFMIVKDGNYENIGSRDQDLKAWMILEKNIPWEGRKTNTFYNNLMNRDGVTADMWMARVFGFEDDAMIRNLKYDFIEGITNKVAKDLTEKYGVEVKPQQAQAAIWIAHKARASGLDINEAGKSYADFIEDHFAQISWESVPSTSKKHLLGIGDLDDVVKADYHVAVSKAFLDDDGRDIIAKKLQMLSPGDFDAPGMYEGVSNPSTQVNVATGKVKQTDVKGFDALKIAAEDKELLSLYSAFKGLLLSQDSVAFHRPIVAKNQSAKFTNAMEINVGRIFTAPEMRELEQLLGNEGIALVGSAKGVRMLNFTDLDNPSFITYVKDRLADFSIPKIEIEYYAFDGDLIDVGNYERIIQNSGRSDLQGDLLNIVSKKEAIDRSFAKEHNLEFDGTEYDYIRELIGKINTQ